MSFLLFLNIILYFSKTEVINDGGVKKLVNEQMTQWSEMVERHRREKWALQKQQATEQQDALIKLMENLQAAQMKGLEIRHEKYESTYFLHTVVLNRHRN